MMTPGSDPPFRVLVPIDGSPLADQAIAYAATLCGPNDEVILLYVAPYPTPPLTRKGTELPVTDQYLERYEEEARVVTARSAAIWQPIVPELSQHVEFGEPAERIIAFATSHRVDVIVIATHDRSTFGLWLHPSIAGEVTRRSPVSVLVVRRQDSEESFGAAPIHRIIVPLDGTKFSARALPMAERLAKRLHRPLLLLHVEPKTLVPTSKFGAIAADAAARDAALAAEHDATVALQAAVASLEANGVAADWEIDVGEPFERISEAARHGELIVLASHARRGVDRWAFGSMAEKLIRRADAPVLIVRGEPIIEFKAPAEPELSAVS